MKVMRYEQLTDALSQMRVETVVEIGVWNGVRAQELAGAALRNSPSVQYQGFDLFESLTDEELEEELSKRPPSEAEVRELLDRFRARVERRGRILKSRRRSFQFELHQGYTRDTLPAFIEARPDFRADFVWLDGGHKVETIANDWGYTSRMLADDGVLYLDDYYGNDELAERFGCNQLVAQLRDDDAWEAEVLPVRDTIPDMGTIQIVRVKRR